MEATETVESMVRTFVVETYLPGGRADDQFTDQTDLVDVGVVDSMNVLRLVDFLEETFDFMLEPEDLFRMTTIDGIAEVVREHLV